MNIVFEIGDKVTWTIGRADRPIILRGLFLDKVSKYRSKIVCYEQNGMPRNAKIKVQTKLLKKE